MFHNKKWSRELCVQRVDEFVRREQRYPTPQERTPKCGLPSDTAFRAHTGISMIKYCRANYPNMETQHQAAPEHSAPAEQPVPEAESWIRCDSLDGYPERADDPGAAEYVQELQQQTQSQVDCRMGGMSMS